MRGKNEGKGKGKGKIGDVIEAVAPTKGESEGSADAKIEAAAAGPGSSEAEADAARALPVVGEVPRKADRMHSPVEDLIFKRIRAIRKKIKQAEATLLPHEREMNDKLNGFKMVEQELENIRAILPDVLAAEKLLLSASKEPPSSAIPKEAHDVEAKGKEIQTPSSTIPEGVGTVMANEPETTSASEEASAVNRTGKSTIPEGVGTVKTNEPETTSASEEASAVNRTGKSTATDPVPPAEEKKKGTKPRPYMEAAMAKPDKDSEAHFASFLSMPTRHQPYYRSQLAAIAKGFCSILHVSYKHIDHFSRNFAMTICANYKRIKNNLTTAAFKYMNQSFSVKSETKLTLKLIGLPRRHQKFQQFLHYPLQVVNVFGEKGTVKKPSQDFCYKLQVLLFHMMNNHAKGLSWAGDFSVDDINVFNENIVVIMKTPQQLKDQSELIKAAEKDFVTVANEILSKVSSPGSIIPYFNEFNYLLRNMSQHASLWSDYKLAEHMRDLVGHHPFLKPPVAVASLFAGIHNSFCAYDKGDETAAFKKNMKGESGFSGWTHRIMESDNSLLVDQYEFKEKIKKKAGKIPDSNDLHDMVVDSEEYDQLLNTTTYRDNLQSFVEYIRHLFNHGTDKTKEKRKLLTKADGTLFDPNPTPRKQFMVSIEETEVAASIHVGSFVCLVLYTFAKADSFKGMLTPFWEAYKNCCFRTSAVIGDSTADQWLPITSDDDDFDAE